MDTLVKRLRAIVRNSGSKQDFIRAMEKARVPGSSQPAVYRYLRGAAEPCIEFLVAAARYGNVSTHWLILGDEGAPVCSECSKRADRVRRAVAILTDK